MSQTVPVEVVGRTYWTYVASAMVEGLDDMLHEDAGSSVIPKRVYVDAQEFFRVALEATEEEVPTNPALSISNYLIASDAVRAKGHGTPDDGDNLRALLLSYQELLRKLQNGHVLEAAEKENAQALRDFFSQLQNDAEAEAYHRVVRFDPPQ